MKDDGVFKSVPGESVCTTPFLLEVEVMSKVLGAGLNNTQRDSKQHI